MIRSTLFNVAFTTAAFGMAPFFKKLAIVNGASAWMAALVPVVCAALTTLLIAYSQRRELLACLFGRRQMLSLILVGVTATGLVTLLVAHALTTTTATNRSLFQAAYPAATLLLAHGLLGERLRLLQYAVIAVMMGGILLMNGSGGGEVRFGQGFWLLCLTLPLIGFGDVYAKRLTGRLSPLLLSCGRSFYGAVFILCSAPFLELGAWPGAINGLWLAAAGACQGLGIWTLYRAFRTSKASLVASLIAAAPLVTAGAELAFMDLHLNLLQWWAVALVVAMAAWLAHSREAERPARPSGRAA